MLRNGRELDGVPGGNNDWEAWKDLESDIGRGERLVELGMMVGWT
jgi:hypothetical protein